MSGTETEWGDQPQVTAVQLTATNPDGTPAVIVPALQGPSQAPVTVPGDVLVDAAAQKAAPSSVDTLPAGSQVTLTKNPDGTWTLGVPVGSQGEAGASTYTGSGAPTIAANNGDSYIDVSTGGVWAFQDGAWANTGVVLSAPSLAAYAAAAASSATQASASATTAGTAAGTAQAAANSTLSIGSQGMPFFVSGVPVAVTVTYSGGKLAPMQDATGRALQTLANGAVEQVISRPEATSQISAAVAAEAAARLATLSTGMPYIYGSIMVGAAVTYQGTGQIAPFQDTAGRALQTLSNGSVEQIISRPEVAAQTSSAITAAISGSITLGAVPLPDGDAPSSITVNAAGQTVAAQGQKGSDWIANPAGLNKRRTYWDRGETFKTPNFNGYGNGNPGVSGTLNGSFAILRNIKLLRVMLGGGQSLMQAWDQTNDSLISTTAIYPNQYFKLNYANGAFLRPGVLNRAIGLVPGVEDLLTTGCKESIFSSAINHLIRMLNAADPNDPQYFLAANVAFGGTPLEQLRIGSQQGQQFRNAVEDAVRLGRAAGFDEIRVDTAFCNYGQSNGSEVAGNTAQYRGYFGSGYVQMMQEYNRLAKAITGQSQNMRFLSEISDYMVPSFAPYLASNFDQPILMGLLDTRGYPDHFLVGGAYHAPRDESRTDRLHRNSAGYYRRGIDFADARFRIEEGFGYTDPHPFADTILWLSSTQFSVQFSCQIGAAPYLDTSGAEVNITGNSPNGAGNATPDSNNCVYTGATAPIAGYMGCLFDDGTASPPSITAIDTTPGNGRVTFTLSAPPAGLGRYRLAYATTRSPLYTLSSHADGNLVGARGALRENGMGILDITGTYTFNRWFAPFILDIPKQ